MSSNKKNSKFQKLGSKTDLPANVIPFKKRQDQNLSQASPEELLEQFQKRLFEARFQIRQLELKKAALENTPNPDPLIIQDLHLQSEAILNRQRAWLHQLSVILIALRKERKDHSR